MRFAWLAIAAAVIASAVAGGDAHAAKSFETGNDLWMMCGSTSTGLPPARCESYVIGTFDGYQTISQYNAINGPRICAVGDISNHQITDVVRRYFEIHPEDRHYSAASSIYVALSQAFPCRTK